jgi:nitrogen regulatory protein P-II 1
MQLNALIAIVRRQVLERVEDALRAIGVVGISISKVKGYGEYHNFFAADGMTDSVRIEIFTRSETTAAITTAIVDAAHTGSRGDGIVVVYPISSLVNIRLRAEAFPDAHEAVPGESS